MPFAAPVVLVRLQSSRRFDEETHKNLDALVERFQASLVTETEHFYYLLKHNKPKVAILADNAVSLNENDDLRQLLYEYVKAGGTVILALKFAVMCAEPNLDNMFKDLGIPMWTHADSSLYGYTRDNLFLNPVMKTIFPPAAHAELGPNYKIKAVHIEGVDDRDKMYYPWAEDKGSIARVPGHNSACPSAFTKIGAGYLGYVGDFPLKYGTVKIMKAMISESSLSFFASTRGLC